MRRKGKVEELVGRTERAGLGGAERERQIEKTETLNGRTEIMGARKEWEHIENESTERTRAQKHKENTQIMRA
jgi:hypothetical protein